MFKIDDCVVKKENSQIIGKVVKIYEEIDVIVIHTISGYNEYSRKDELMAISEEEFMQELLLR